MNLVGVQLERRHRGVAGVDTFGQRLPKPLDGISQMQVPEWRGGLERTVGYPVDRVATGAVAPRKDLAPLLRLGGGKSRGSQDQGYQGLAKYKLQHYKADS